MHINSCSHTSDSRRRNRTRGLFAGQYYAQLLTISCGFFVRQFVRRRVLWLHERPVSLLLIIYQG